MSKRLPMNARVGIMWAGDLIPWLTVKPMTLNMASVTVQPIKRARLHAIGLGAPCVGRRGLYARVQHEPRTSWTSGPARACVASVDHVYGRTV